MSAVLLSVADLLNRPGLSRPLDVSFPVPADLDLPLVEGIDPLAFHGVLESLVDGVLVRGTLSTRVAMACARCLRPVEHEVAAEVAELYADPAHREEIEPGYEVRDGVIDVEPLLRDTLLPLIPVAPRCRPDCQGLCPTCGADRNSTDCGCEQDLRDSRWAALEGLRIQE